MGYAEVIAPAFRGTVDHAHEIMISPQASRAATCNETIDGIHVGQVASSLIRHRRGRYGLFDQALFADPAWEILLALTVAECGQERVTVSKLCGRVDVPMTTTLRWIGILTEAGLLIRRDDPTDKRRKFIQLSPEAFSRMAEYCSGPAHNAALAA